MAARNAYILSGVLHLIAIGLVLLMASRPATQIRPLQKYQPVRLLAPAGKPGPIKAKSEPEAKAPPIRPKSVSRSTPKVIEKTKPKTPAKRQDKAQEGSKESSGKAVGSGIEGVDNVRLDGANFPYPYYLSNIQIKILSNFKPVISAEKAQGLKAVVYFIINRNGRIADVKIESKSGHFLFDQEAQRAVLRSNPLPALPPAFGSDRLGVHFEFVASQ